MPRFILRDESRKPNYYLDTPDAALCLDGLNTGALLRLADAAEKMAQRHTELIEQRDRYERYWEESRRTIQNRDRTIAALRGQITKLKKRLAAPIDTHEKA